MSIETFYEQPKPRGARVSWGDYSLFIDERQGYLLAGIFDRNRCGAQIHREDSVRICADDARKLGELLIEWADAKSRQNR